MGDASARKIGNGKILENVGRYNITCIQRVTSPSKLVNYFFCVLGDSLALIVYVQSTSTHHSASFRSTDMPTMGICYQKHSS